MPTDRVQRGRARNGQATTPGKAVVDAALSCHLTTPHKLQAEARSRKGASRRQGVYPSRKPMAEACQLHAVVRWHRK
jgi:hypothetical protein